MCRRKRSIRDKSNHGAILRQPCRFFEKVLARNRLVNIGILPSVNSTKEKRVAKPEISACSRIIRLMNNQIKNQKELQFSKRKRKRRQHAVAIVLYHNWVVSRSTRSHCILKEENSPGETPMQKVLGPIRKVRFTQSTLRQASIREKKGPSLGHIQVKVPHQRSPNAMKYEDRSHEETERQQRCARSKAWNLAKNIFKLKKKDKATFYSPAEKWVLQAASTKEPEEKGVCGGIRSKCTYGQQERL